MSEDRLKHSFLNHVRSLFNIDGYLLPELTKEQQQEFIRDPVRYFIRTDKAQSDAIWREILKRQSNAPWELRTLLEIAIDDHDDEHGKSNSPAHWSNQARSILYPNKQDKVI